MHTILRSRVAIHYPQPYVIAFGTQKLQHEAGTPMCSYRSLAMTGRHKFVGCNARMKSAIVQAPLRLLQVAIAAVF